MSSTTPAPERAPRDRAGEVARSAPGAVPPADPADAPGPGAGVAMRTLLAACAAAEAVSTPPAYRRQGARPPVHRTAA
ncbi:hypothetical protein [Kitasatospora sp. NBC_00315]|uniref:hypothetical protein n=1 Tax=Kitasatospora sp. NBC_00315 TaxID=2975963 RepID=UPI003244748C